MEILISVSRNSDVRTNSVKGAFGVQEALDRMLEGTPFVAVPVSGGKAFGGIKRAKKGGNVPKRSRNKQLKNIETKTQMNLEQSNSKQKRGGLFKGLLALAVAGSPNISAQDEDVVHELSPFTVDASEDTGYRATTTIAGTRIKTQLRDIASSISVYTEEFIEDTGSSDITDLLVYAVGVEVDGMNGNFTSAIGSGNFDTVDFNSQALQNQTSTRVRGLANADRTRNFFGSIVPIDTYNVDRVVVNRGANNILFGLGSPAGIIN